MPANDSDHRGPLESRIIREHLSAVLESPQFAKSNRLKRFLSFVVENKLAGRDDEIQEYAIGLEVYDRRASFDPRSDSIVRVEARRLRDRLADYYRQPRGEAQIRIVLPERGYVPTFEPVGRESSWTLPVILGIAAVVVASVLTVVISRPVHHKPLPQAREAFEKGLAAWNQWTGDGARQAEYYFKQAIAFDPAYARAHAWLSAAYRQQATMGDAAPGEAYAKASQAAERAIALDPLLSDGYHALATNLTFKPDWKSSERTFRTAIRLGPDQADNYHAFGIVLLAASSNRLLEAESEVRRAIGLRPGELGNRVVLAKILYFRGRFGEARLLLEEVLAINRHYPDAMRNLAAVLLQLGEAGEAIRLHRQAQQLAYLGWGDGLLGHALAVSGDTRGARDLLDTLESSYAARPVGALAIATIHVGLQNWAPACEWLSHAWDNREIRARYLNVDPIYVPLRDNPCFARLLEEMQLASLSTPTY